MTREDERKMFIQWSRKYLIPENIEEWVEYKTKSGSIVNILDSSQVSSFQRENTP